MLLDEINKLDEYLYGGAQINERNVAVYIQYLLCSLGLSLDKDFVSANLPTVLRSMPISLVKEPAKKIFKFLCSVGQQSTDMDILFINVPSFFGHRSNANYYVEVEMLKREDIAIQRLLDFYSFCIDKGIELYPILVTNFRETRFIQSVCILPIEELRRIATHGVRLINDVRDIPGIAWDSAASCFYILEVLTQQMKTMKSDMLEKVKSSDFLWRKKLNLERLISPSIDLKNSLDREDEDNFVYRMNGYISTLKEKGLMEDTPDKKAYQITYEGSKYILRWRGSVSSYVR